jgi:hypothetical protein
MLAVVIGLSGCAGPAASNYWSGVGQNLREYANNGGFEPTPSEKYVYKDAYGRQVGSVERARY